MLPEFDPVSTSRAAWEINTNSEPCLDKAAAKASQDLSDGKSVPREGPGPRSIYLRYSLVAVGGIGVSTALQRLQRMDLEVTSAEIDGCRIVQWNQVMVLMESDRRESKGWNDDAIALQKR